MMKKVLFAVWLIVIAVSVTIGIYRWTETRYREPEEYAYVVYDLEEDTGRIVKTTKEKHDGHKTTKVEYVEHDPCHIYCGCGYWYVGGN